MAAHDDYEPGRYWSEVAEHLGSRPADAEVAGDITPYSRDHRRRFLQELFSRVPLDGRTVLEVGCGPGGNLLEALSRHAARATGCDLAPPMARLARSQLPRSTADVVQIGGNALPFRDEAFDVSFTATVLHHNRSDVVRALLSELCRVSRDEVVLFEDTSARSKERFSYFVRPVDEYRRGVESTGPFRLKSVAVLGDPISRRTARVIQRLFRSAGSEGADVSRAQLVIERATLPVTRSLDRLSPARAGLTMMSFGRR